MTKRYEIRGLYRARSEYHHHDDSTYENEWQLEIYLHALGLMKKHDLRSVLDVGCGSGYKLITYLGAYDTVGAELPVNLEHLRSHYPGRTWIASDFASTTNLAADVVICSDVIEHLTDPDELLDYLKRIRHRFLVLSTPARNLLYRPWHPGFWGPPANPTHQREWTFEEFGRYIRQHFDVVDHRVTNLQQATQMVICSS
jgi:SAM-dependent methyltransferase